MFAQLLITVALVFVLAEGLSRWLLGKSFGAALQEIFTDPPEETSPPTPEESLRDLVEERRQALASARLRARLAHRAAAVTDDLSASAAEVAEAEAKLAEAERRLRFELEDETCVLG